MKKGCSAYGKIRKAHPIEEECDRLKNELANVSKFFSATNEFREDMPLEIIAFMACYNRIERILKRYQDKVFTPVATPPPDIGVSPWWETRFIFFPEVIPIK